MNLKELEKQLINNKNENKTINDFFKNIGLDIINYRSITPTSCVELPTRIYRGTLNRVKMSAFSYIGRDVYIFDTIIKRYCSIAKGVNIGQGNHPTNWLSSNPFQYQESFRIQTGNLYEHHEKYGTYFVNEENRREVKKDVIKPKTVIGNDVWIGAGVIILPGIKIGDGAVIGGGSVVTKNIPPYAIAVGNPAKVKKYRFSENIIKKLMKLQWWDYSPWDLHKFNIKFYDIEDAIVNIEYRKAEGDLTPYINKEVEVAKLIELYNRVML